MDCWHAHFPIEAHLRAELTPEDWEKSFNRPLKPKVTSLLELIEQAKKVKKQEM